MMSINDLPDDLLVKILSSLPLSEHTVLTSLLSKRWRDLWKLVPQLMFDDQSFDNCESFVNFVGRSLKFNNKQALESLHLKLHQYYWNMDDLVQAAVDRSVRELVLQSFDRILVLPSCLTTCKTLETLILSEVMFGVFDHQFRLPFLKTLSLSSAEFMSVGCILQKCPILENLVVQKTKVFAVGELDELSSTYRTLKALTLSEVSITLFPEFFSLPSLKILHLSSVKFSDDESVASLLKICCVLERLVINRTEEDNVLIYNIDVPTLMSLSIRSSSIKNKNKKKSHRRRTYIPVPHGFVIKAPSLTELNFEDTTSNFIVFESMPEVIKANIDVFYGQFFNYIGFLTSMTPYPEGTSFSSLKHLELCTCSEGWAKLLVCMLNDSPKVQSLKLKSNQNVPHDGLMNFWKEPKVVPKCLPEHLKILEWRQYLGTVQESSVAEYILANATCLKMATFSSRYITKKHRIGRKLKSMHRVSKTCQLVFD